MKVSKLALKIGKSTIIQSLGKAISAVLGLITVALLTRYLGTSGYGNFTLVFSYLAFFSLISDFGLQIITVKEISSTTENIENLYGTYLRIKILLGIISSLLSLIFLYFFPYPLELKLGIILGVITVFISGQMGYFNTIFQSRLRLDLVTLFDLVGKFLTVIAIIIFVSLRLNFYYIISSVLIGNLLSFIFAAIVLKDTLNTKYDVNIALKLLKLSIPVGFTSLLSTFYFKIDTIILSLLKPSADVGIYSLAYKLLENIVVFWGFYMAVTFPILSQLKKSNGRKYVQILKSSTILAVVTALPIILVSYFLSPLVIRVFGGEQFSQSLTSFRILLFSLPLIFLNNIFYNFYVIEEKNSVIFMGMIASLILNIILNIIFIPKYSYIAASYITILSEIVLLSCYFLGMHLLRRGGKNE